VLNNNDEISFRHMNCKAYIFLSKQMKKLVWFRKMKLSHVASQVSQRRN
jgi:hypothetical protein